MGHQLISLGGGVTHNVMEVLMLDNQPPKWTLSGVISVGVFATLNSMTPCISKPKMV